MLSTEANVVPFGKYRGQPVEALLADQNYVTWIMGQPGIVQMLQAKHPTLFNIITIGAPQSDDTPEHNRIQARFTDRAFQLAFIEAATGETPMRLAERFAEEANAEAATLLKQAHESAVAAVKSVKGDIEILRNPHPPRDDGYNFMYIRRANDAAKIGAPELERRLSEAERVVDEMLAYRHSKFSVIPPTIRPTFECGYDVDLEIEWEAETYERKSFEGPMIWPPKIVRAIRMRRFRSSCAEYPSLAVEIKPQMGDDFPSVLRQMRTNKARYLLVGTFDAEGATLEQVRVMFGGLRIVLLSEVEAILKRDVALA